MENCSYIAVKITKKLKKTGVEKCCLHTVEGRGGDSAPTPLDLVLLKDGKEAWLTWLHADTADSSLKENVSKYLTYNRRKY